MSRSRAFSSVHWPVGDALYSRCCSYQLPQLEAERKCTSLIKKLQLPDLRDILTKLPFAEAVLEKSFRLCVKAREETRDKLLLSQQPDGVAWQPSGPLKGN